MGLCGVCGECGSVVRVCMVIEVNRTATGLALLKKTDNNKC